MILELLFGSLVGATLGLMGGGGSALAVPLLAYGLGLGAKEAIATSLLVVGLAALAGAVRHWQQGTVDLRVALIFGIFGSVGGGGGAQIARFLEPRVQMTLFAVSLIAASGIMLRHRTDPVSDAAQATRIGLRAVLAALGAGILTGVVGIGGGFVVVPALVFVVGMPMHRAVGTSLLVITFNALGGLMSYVSYVTLDTSVVVPFSVAAVLWAVAAAIRAREMDERKLRSAFAVGLVVIGVFTIVKEGLGF